MAPEAVAALLAGSGGGNHGGTPGPTASQIRSLTGLEAAAAEPALVPREKISAAVGVLNSGRAEEVFDDAGRNPRVSKVSSSSPGYLFRFISWTHRDRFEARMRDAHQLNRHVSRGDPTPLTKTFTVTTAKDPGETAAPTVTVQATLPDNPTWIGTGNGGAPPPPDRRTQSWSTDTGS